METTAALAALSALAQESRLAIFRHLIELGPEGAHVGAIGAALDLPAPTLSFHLKELSHAGLVDGEQVGRFVRYRAQFDAMQALVDYLTKNCCGGDSSRCAPRTPGRSAGRRDASHGKTKIQASPAKAKLVRGKKM